VVTANPATGTVSLLLGNGNDTFASAQQFAAGPSPRTLVVADVNGDGRPDVVVIGLSSGTQTPTLSVLLNDGHW
jgi:hypothetical protein